MIDQSKLTDEWIEQVAKEHKADPLLIEKVIRALLLLEGLVKVELPLVFKGGTALMLHFNSTKRLSIDIDIILTEEQSNMDEMLDEVVNRQGFSRWELQERNTQSTIQKEHYKLYYEPLYKTQKDEEYVLLDILIEEVHYAEIIQLPIQSPFAPQDGDPIEVDVSTAEDLLGDKLTAFAPNTTGIPYFKKDDSMSMEIIKQLYDIGNLFDEVDQLDIIKKTFQKFADAELAYRQQDGFTADDVLEDIYETSLSIATRGYTGKAKFDELQAGIQRIKAFIFSESYHIEKAITDASKAAYLATLIEQDATDIEKFSNPSQMKDWVIEQPMSTKLNKLKKSNPEAFFYWYRIFEMRI
jgi:predicted nucleotidyltransferase component of viral defense system